MNKNQKISSSLCSTFFMFFAFSDFPLREKLESALVKIPDFPEPLTDHHLQLDLVHIFLFSSSV